jgi:hypothetical protein
MASHLYEFIVIGAGIALGLLAFQRPNRVTIPIAVAVMSTAAATVLWAGQLAFPVVYYIARLRSEYHLRAALLFAMLVTPPILYWRMPWPRPLPASPTAHAIADVATVRTVNHIGGGPRTKGQGLRVPFQVATLSFTAYGNRAPLTLTDTVDSGSVVTLQKRGEVDVLYSPFNPAGARVAGGTRRYAEDLWWHVMELVYGVTLAVAIVVEILVAMRATFGGGALSRRALRAREGISRPFGR